jgi:hypothetical protein
VLIVLEHLTSAYALGIRIGDGVAIDTLPDLPLAPARSGAA